MMSGVMAKVQKNKPNSKQIGTMQLAKMMMCWQAGTSAYIA
jgi:hypothetical protein